MTKRSRKCLAAVLVPSVAFVALATTAAYGEGPPTKTETSMQAIQRAAEQDGFEAQGTWWTKNGAIWGTWRLCDGFQITKNGEWNGAIVVSQFEDPEPQSLSGESRAAKQVTVAGSLAVNEMYMRVVRSAEDTAVADQPVPVFPGAAQGVLSGVRIEGDFVSGDGVAGGWDGWWHAWGAPDDGGAKAASDTE